MYSNNLLMSIFNLALLIQAAYGCKEDASCSTTDPVCIYDCARHTKNPYPNLFGLGTDETKNYGICVGNKIVFEGKCTSETPERNEQKMCPGIQTSDKIKVGCNATLFNHFCDFECNEGFVSHPSLRYRENINTTGKVQCLDSKRFLSSNLCVLVCADGQVSKNGACGLIKIVCSPGYGPDESKGGNCTSCGKNTFSKGLMPCGECPYKGTIPNENKDDCVLVPKASSPTKCKRGPFSGSNSKKDIKLDQLKLEIITSQCSENYTEVSSEILAVCYKSGELSVQTVCSKECRDPPKNSTFKTEGPFSYMEHFEYKCAEKTYVNGNTSMTEGSGVCDLDGLIVISGACLANPRITRWNLTNSVLIIIFVIIFIAVITGFMIFGIDTSRCI